MTEQDVDETLKECEDIFKRFDNVEERAKGEIVKYFDRIHDKLFAYQLFFLAGYISLIAIPSISISVWWLLLPVFGVGRLIHIDWKMMEQNRKIANIKQLTSIQIEELNKELRTININSLEVVLESILTTIGFIGALVVK